MIIVSSVFIMTSCKKNEVKPEEKPQITISGVNTVEFFAEAGSKDFSFNTKVQWYISYEPEEWLAITSQGGEAGDVDV